MLEVYQKSGCGGLQALSVMPWPNKGGVEENAAAGKGSYMAQTKSKRRVQVFGEVFTAQREVNAMCDLLPPEMFQPERTFLEPCCGEGVFLLEILRRKFARCKSRAEFSTALASVWGMEIQEDNVETTIRNILELSREHFKPSKKDEETVERHIIQCDSLKIMGLLEEMQKHEEYRQRKPPGALRNREI